MLKGQGIANPVPPVEALAVMAVLEAAVRSAEVVWCRLPDLSDDERNTLRDNPPCSPVTCARPAGNRYFRSTLEKITIYPAD